MTYTSGKHAKGLRYASNTGLQKNRHRGTSGAKEGFSSIGRFSKN